MPVQIGKMRLRRSGADIALVGYGNPVNDCLAAAELLQQVCGATVHLYAVMFSWAAWRGLFPPDACAYHDAYRPLQAGVSATVVDARFCKPLDTDMLRKLAKEHPLMVTVEEGSIGGFAAHVMQV